ncbi:MAG: metalloregulator ArsR/SmtB family transcription factor [Gaiellales bacterium]
MGDRVDDVFVALADPSRRHLVERLAARGASTPTELSAELPVTRQAVAKHLATLEAAGLVQRSREGRNTVVRFDPTPLEEAGAWLARVGAQWDMRLAALAEHVSRPRGRETSR